MAEDPTADSILTRGNIAYFLVVPGRLEFAWRVRRYLLERRPGVVAVELPVLSRSALPKSASASAANVGYLDTRK